MRSAAFPEPMLARTGPLPVGAGWRYEVKWDGFRALVSTEAELRVRSRNGWTMTRLLPELEPMPRGLLLDGELVARGDSGLPDFDRLCARLLHGDSDVAVTFMVFDVLRIDGHSLLDTAYERRRRLLEDLDVNGAAWFTPDVFDDGEALWRVVCDRGLEGVVAKRLSSLYRPRHRGGGWVKRKSPTWPRRDRELETLRRKFGAKHPPTAGVSTETDLAAAELAPFSDLESSSLHIAPARAPETAAPTTSPRNRPLPIDGRSLQTPPRAPRTFAQSSLFVA